MCFDVYSAFMSSVEADIQTDIQILLKLPTSAMPLCTTTIENFPPETPWRTSISKSWYLTGFLL